MNKQKKIAFIFPGQGTQYTEMGKDFSENFSEAKHTFKEANDILGYDLSSIIFNGPDSLLTETKNSQLAIYTVSTAILRVVQKLYPNILPTICSGLSLGEYTALTAAGKLSFENGLNLVKHRAQFMNDACESTKGTMAVIIGLEADVVEAMVKEINMPRDLWAANFNCPGQVVISGTPLGIEAGTKGAKEKGAKRILPLSVHGAFHSGLMKQAEERLTPYIKEAAFKESDVGVVMNYTGDFTNGIEQIRTNLIKQVTHPVRWEQGIRSINNQGVDLFIEMGCGKTLAGMNKRIGVACETISIEKITDIDILRS